MLDTLIAQYTKEAKMYESMARHAENTTELTTPLDDHFQALKALCEYFVRDLVRWKEKTQSEALTAEWLHILLEQPKDALGVTVIPLAHSKSLSVRPPSTSGGITGWQVTYKKDNQSLGHGVQHSNLHEALLRVMGFNNPIPCSANDILWLFDQGATQDTKNHQWLLGDCVLYEPRADGLWTIQNLWGKVYRNASPRITFLMYTGKYTPETA